MSPSDFPADRHLVTLRIANPRRRGISHVENQALSTCRSQYPGGGSGCIYTVASPKTHRPSPLCRRVGVRDSVFRGLLGIHSRSACGFAGPPMVNCCPRDFCETVSRGRSSGSFRDEPIISRAGLSPAGHDFLSWRTTQLSGHNSRRDAILFCRANFNPILRAGSTTRG